MITANMPSGDGEEEKEKRQEAKQCLEAVWEIQADIIERIRKYNSTIADLTPVTKKAVT